jgi:hypothetical protein
MWMVTVSFSRSTLLVGIGHVFGNVRSDRLHVSWIYGFEQCSMRLVPVHMFMFSFCVVTSHHLSAVFGSPNFDILWCVWIHFKVSFMPVLSTRCLCYLTCSFQVWTCMRRKFCILAHTFVHLYFIHQICTVLCFVCNCLLFPSHHALFSCAYTVLKNISCVYYLTAVPCSAPSFVEVRLCFFKCRVYWFLRFEVRPLIRAHGRFYITYMLSTFCAPFCVRAARSCRLRAVQNVSRFVEWVRLCSLGNRIFSHVMYVHGFEGMFYVFVSRQWFDIRHYW